MTSATYLPTIEDCRNPLKPTTEWVIGDPRSQYWVRYGVLFYGDSVVQGADSTTFHFFLSSYGTDSKGVFREGKRDRTLNASSFRCYSFAYHGDHSAVRTWYGGVIRDADTSTFEALDAGYEALAGGDLPFLLYPTGYARDREKVYWCDRGGKGMHVVKADPATFERVNCHFGKDDRHVYSGRTSLPKADPKTWRQIAGYFSADANRVYHVSSTVEGADPETFQVQSTSRGSFLFASDKNAFYDGSRKISRADYEKGIS